MTTKLLTAFLLAAGLIVEAVQNPAEADTTPPVLNLPADITQNNDAGQCGANVPFNVTATDDSGSATVTAEPASGSFFAVGTTTVVATATDPSGNSAQGSFDVTVNDVEAPVLVTQDITLELDANGTARLNVFDGALVSQSDNCSTVGTVGVSGPRDYTCDNLGQNTVWIFQDDPSGNEGSASFVLTVTDPLGVCPATLTIIKDASPAVGTDFDFTINSTPLPSYSGSTSGNPVWTRPNEGTTCTLSTNSVHYHVQSFMVDASGNYSMVSQQNYNGYLHLYQDSFNPTDQCTNYLNGSDDTGIGSNQSEIFNQPLEAGRVYYLVTSGFASANAGTFTNYISGVGTVYTLASSFTLDDAVPDDSDGVNDSITFTVEPDTYSITELLPNSAWSLTGATCTGASGSDSLENETLSVEVASGETVQCTFTNESLCPASWTVTTADELHACITEANGNGAGLDTITLGADIDLTTLTTSPLPQITTEITLEGENHFIDGGWDGVPNSGTGVRIFYVAIGGDFTVNQATLQNGNAPVSSGGAIWNNKGGLTVTNTNLSGNRASTGGAIFNDEAGLTVINSVFLNNSAIGGDGGAIYTYASVATVISSTFSSNSASAANGGGISNDLGTLTMTDSTFSGNSASNNGGGISHNVGTVMVTNSTFSGNSATNEGGGIFTDSPSGTLTVTSSTFFGNSAGSIGGGIINVGTLNLAGTIFAAGSSGENCVNFGGTLNDNGYNLSDDATCTDGGAGSVDNATLNLGALADNGGATQTHLPGAGSAAIGAIPNGTTISNNGTSWTCNDVDTFTDQRGESRPINSLTACTAGAVEVAIPLCPTWTATTADELYDCITLANANDSPSPTADTITLGADIDLTTLTINTLPQISTEIALEGAGYVVDGGDIVQLFDVASGGDFTVNQATLQNGAATDGGAIINSGALTVTNSTFFSNIATDAGGAIANADVATLTVANSTFANNVAGVAGSIINAGTATVTLSTFSDNLAGSIGSGITNLGTLNLAGTIFATGISGDNCVNWGTLNDNGYNLSEDSTCTNGGTGSATNVTLNLGSLADNGGPTPTHLPGPASAAISAIPNGTTLSNNGTSWTCNDVDTFTDQRGESRPINSGDGCTSGAVEVAPICPAWTVSTADELSECITLANANESPGPTADTITLGASIVLTSPLPQISTDITLEGAGYAIDGGDSVQLFNVSGTGDFTVNQATLQNGNADNGGAINNEGAVTVLNSTLSGNSATEEGGAIKSGNGTVTVINSTFSGNSARFGGAIEINGGTTNVSNSTFSGNSATLYGGSIYNVGTLTVTNSTFSGNTASDGSILNENGTLNLAGNLFVAGLSGNNCVNEGIFNDNGYNLSDDATCTKGGSGSATNATLNLGSLANNGGPTLTHLPGAGSAAIGVIPYGTTLSNNGSSWSCNEVDTFTDQRGESRPINALTGCSAGAVEVAIPICTTWTATTADELYQCITLANGNENPSPSADTITLGADINLTSLTASPLPQISTEITLEGTGYTVDGGNSLQLFNVGAAGDFTVSQATLQNGSADNGGAINNEGAVTVLNSTFSGNAANSGGGIFSLGTLTVLNSTFSDNSATGGGGAITDGGTLTVTNSTFFSNNATSTGGGIVIAGTPATVSRSTFSDNTAPNGGAIYLAVNRTLHLAGNIFVAGASGDNCLNFGNIANLIDNGYNLSDDATCTNVGTGSATNATLNLGALADNGGATLTQLPGAGSDAIGAIPNGTSISNNGSDWSCNRTFTDQRGYLRPLKSGGACTAGAIEAGIPYTIGGSVSGLASGNSVTLSNNGGDPLTINDNTSFTFPDYVLAGEDYDVSVSAQPAGPNQTCEVSNGSSNVTDANVTDILVYCVTDQFTIGGTVSGLTGSGLVLQNNLTDDLPIAADGSFTFDTALDDLSPYSVSVKTQPGSPSQTCTVSNDSGNLAGANVTDILVNCVTDQFTVGGTVSGLTGSGLVLQNNLTDDLPIAADGSFTFDTALDDLSPYSVSVKTQPGSPSQTCTVSNGAGDVNSADITNVMISCGNQGNVIFKDGFEVRE